VGGDVDAMASGARIDVPARAASLRQRMEAVRLLHEMPKPTIACVNGSAAGAGLALALACDIRIVSATATLTTAFARIGVSGDYGCLYFLTHLVGTGKARELCFTAARFSGAEAVAMGIASKAVPKDEVDEAARALASELAAGPTAALASMKRNLNEALRGNLSEYLDAEARRQIESLQTSDHREGVAAFRAKRPPDFRGS
jgi:2-(1,2-epoxy-1,2-dihydrophenyl)acetyl-CoA isomerase